MKVFRNIVLIFVFLSLALGINAQSTIKNQNEKKTTRLLFVFDASQSMFGRWDYEQKIFSARRILSNWLDSLSGVENLEVALRVFGDQYPVPPQVCEDSRLVVPFSKDNFGDIKKALREIVPNGTTPITYALEQSANDFPEVDNSRNIIVLITDGIEECEGDPCAISLMLQQKGIIIKPFVIGIGKDFKSTFDCVGTFVEAQTEDDFVSALGVVITQALNNSSAQINLLDANGKPLTTNVTVSIYDHYTHVLAYSFMHTLNGFGVPDTIYLDPRNIYDIEVHSIPPVSLDSVVVAEGRHNTIPISVPIGDMKLDFIGQDQLSLGLQAVVQHDAKTINVQQFKTQEKYLTGYYSLEVLSLPRLIIDSVLISQSHTTKVEIPGPGILVIRKPGLGYGSLFKETSTGLEWVYRFKDNINHTESLYVLPGAYRIIFRDKFSTSTNTTIEKRFTIKTGETVTVNIKERLKK